MYKVELLTPIINRISEGGGQVFLDTNERSAVMEIWILNSSFVRYTMCCTVYAVDNFEMEILRQTFIDLNETLLLYNYIVGEHEWEFTGDANDFTV